MRSTSKSAPAPPVNRRNSGPVPAVRAVVTSVKVSQPPVGATSTEPRSGPVAEPERTSMVPPAPAEETRAVRAVAPAVSREE